MTGTEPVARKRASPLASAAFVGAVALAAIAFVVAFAALRPDPGAVPAASASPSTSGSVAASASPAVAGNPSPTPSATPSAAGEWGLLTRGSRDATLRGESDPAIKKRFAATDRAAVSRDGRRVAYIRTTATGQQVVVFDAARPDSERAIFDLSGSGENADGLVWSVDATDELLLAVHKLGQGIDAPAQYSSLRAVPVSSGTPREILRITGGLYLRPIVWRASTSTGAAIEVSGGGGFAVSYLYIAGGVVARSAFEAQVIATTVRADADGRRVLAVGGLPIPRGVTWWPMERFADRRALAPDPDRDVSTAHWRPGTDEIVVFSAAVSKLIQPAQRLEAWGLDGKRRPIAESAPLAFVRLDGSAAITTGWTVVDLGTGVTTTLPGADREQTPFAPVRL